MSTKYDLIIVGSGPAGLSASIYAERAEVNTLVIEKNYISGGQIVNAYEVDNYPGLPGINGFDMGMKFRDHAEKLGATFLQTEVTGILIEEEQKIVQTLRGDFESKCVIIATGARQRLLGVSGEKEFIGKGVSYCATCDGTFFKNKTVVVVGGGDVAVEDAIFLSRLCVKVYVVHRRDKFRAAKTLQNKLLSLANVEVLWDSVTEEIKGEAQVNEIVIRNVKDNLIQKLRAAGVFIAIGNSPNSNEFRGLVDMDEAGYIIAGEDGVTSTSGIFTAGDVRTKRLRQVITAASDGASTITSVQDYLTSKVSPPCKYH